MNILGFVARLLNERRLSLPLKYDKIVVKLADNDACLITLRVGFLTNLQLVYVIMKPTLVPGIKFEHAFRLTDQKMVPALYPEAPEFQVMPEVFATGFLVGFLEWACLNSVIPHLDWPLEQTVGTHVNISHLARIFHKGGPV